MGARQTAVHLYEFLAEKLRQQEAATKLLMERLEEAKREKEKGNQFYKKKDFDNAIMHYDNVCVWKKGLLLTYLGNKFGP